MLELVKVRVGVTVVDQLVQELERIPYRHLFFIETQELGLLLLYKSIGLILVVQPVELPHAVAARRLIVAVFFCILSLCNSLRIGISFQEIVFPYIKRSK